jgi:hypothetical protein
MGGGAETAPDPKSPGECITDHNRKQGDIHMMLHIVRRLGAVAVLAVGAVHLQQYFGADYNVIPTVGPLFLLNAIGAGAVGFALLAPLHRILGERRGDVAGGVLSVLAVAIALGSLVALFISETGTLFGFSEDGYGTAVVIAIIAEVATVLLLTPIAAISIRRATSHAAHLPSRTPSRRASAF